MPTMRRNPAGGVIDTTGTTRGAGVVRPPVGMRAFQNGGGVAGGEVENEEDNQQPVQMAQASIGDRLYDWATGDQSRRENASRKAIDAEVEAERKMSPRTRQSYYEGLEMPNEEGRARGWKPQPKAPQQQLADEPENQTLADRVYGVISPAFRRRREPSYAGGGSISWGSPAFQQGGYVDGLEDQGVDDAMIDPMQYIQGALNYGRKKYGIPSNDGEMGFDDGGVVPTAPGPEGNPNAVDPRQAMAYLAGDGAVSAEIAQALEQRVDPNGSLDPTERAMEAVQAAPDDESRFGMLQYYRTKYNGFSAAAKAALARGDTGEAAKQATMAMDSVPNGTRTQFAPAPNGLARIDRPVGNRARPQQSFARGGYVQSFQDGEEVLDYTPPEGDDEEDVIEPGVVAALDDQQPEPVTYPQQLDLPERAVPTEPVTREPLEAPTPPYDKGYGRNRPLLINERVRGGGGGDNLFVTSDTDEPTMPDVVATAPQVLPPPEVAKLLDEGFDAKLEAARGQALGGLPAPPTERQRGVYNPMSPPYVPRNQDRANMPILRPELANPLPAEQVEQAYGGQVGLGEQGGANNPPVTPPIPAGAAVAAPARQPYPDEYQAARAVPEKPAAATPVTAPVTAPRAAPAAPAAGAVVDDERWNPLTRTMRAPAPGAFGTREAARRAGTEIPFEMGEPQAPLPKVTAPRNIPYRGVFPTSAAAGQREDDRRSADWRRGTEVHPSGYDRSGAPAYSTRRVPGYGPMLVEQMGHPAFMDPNYRYPDDRQPIYPTTTGRGTIPASQAAAARRTAPDVPAGTSVDMTPADRFAGSRGAGGRMPVAGDARGQGVIPTGGGQRESAEDRIMRRAIELYPSARQQGQREDYINRSLNQLDTQEGQQALEHIKGEKAKQGVIGAAERTQAGITSREKMAADKITEGQRKQESDQAFQLKKQQDAQNHKMLVEAFKQDFRGKIEGNRNATSLLREQMRGKPELITDPFKAQQVLGPHLEAMKLDPKRSMEVARMLSGLDAITGEPSANPFAPGATGGGVGARAPSSVGPAADRGWKPGDRVPMVTDDGRTVIRIIGPDGNGYSEKAYREQFGR